MKKFVTLSSRTLTVSAVPAAIYARAANQNSSKPAADKQKSVKK